MTDLSPRLALPLLAAGQAQKEIFHNEALVTLEAMAQPVAETLGDNVPPSAPALGHSWIVGDAATAAWAGQGGKIALWTAGGWRFIAPLDGMCFWISAQGLWACYQGGSWALGSVMAKRVIIEGNQVIGSRQSGIASPSGGAVVDSESRAAISSILAALRSHGLIAVQ